MHGTQASARPRRDIPASRHQLAGNQRWSGGVAVVLVALLLLPVRAAAGPGDVLRQALAGLDPAGIPTGILYDRVVPMSGLVAQDGSAGAPPVTPAAWRQMLLEMTLASLGPTPWPEVSQIRQAARRARGTGLVPLAVLDLRYDRIRPDALERGLLVWAGGRLSERTGREGAEPYRQARLFAAATLLEETCHGERVEFVLPRSFYLSNEPDPPRRLEIDLADGRGFRPLAPEQHVTASYERAGRKILRLRATRADGTVLQSSFLFTVRARQVPAPSETWPLTATIPYLGGYGTGEAYVYLAEEHATLTEPVLVVEGFDLDNSMNWEELYLLLNREDLLETLRAEGYDAVILNFTESTDYIQRNAFLLVELIQQVQAAVSPDREFPVIGASMGGLVARYALAYLESTGAPPRVSTFISFDAPQNGANIPLGLQYWLDFFQGESADAAYLLSLLDTPAARQMLLYHHTSPPGATGQSDPLRAELQADLAAIGDYPAGPRRVAMANGSGAGADQGYTAGAQIILYEYSSFLVDITGNVWAVPDGTGQQIFDGLIDLIWPLPDTQMSVTVTGTHPYDNAPGGYRASMAQMDSTEAPYGDIVALHDDHGFIPTISALDLATEDPFYDVAGDPDILARTPFDAVYYPLENQEHVLITPENKTWFLAEIQPPLSGVQPDLAAAPAAPVLLAGYPNPFNPATTIGFSLPAAGPVRLFVCDVRGRRIRSLVDGTLPAGRHEVVWRGRDESGRSVAAGIYFYRLEAGAFRDSRRLALVR